MKRRQTRITAQLVFAAVALIFAAVGCKDSNTITGSLSTPKPNALTPTPAPSITGSWSGTWDSWDSASYCQGVPATASFSDVAGQVTGWVKSQDKSHPLSPCVWSADIDGSFHNGHLVGTFASYLELYGIVRGNFKGTELELHFTGFERIGPKFPGSVHLHR